VSAVLENDISHFRPTTLLLLTARITWRTWYAITDLILNENHKML